MVITEFVPPVVRRMPTSRRFSRLDVLIYSCLIRPSRCMITTSLACRRGEAPFPPTEARLPIRLRTSTKVNSHASRPQACRLEPILSGLTQRRTVVKAARKCSTDGLSDISALDWDGALDICHFVPRLYALCKQFRAGLKHRLLEFCRTRRGAP
jgi:hypothetical protein